MFSFCVFDVQQFPDSLMNPTPASRFVLWAKCLSLLILMCLVWPESLSVAYGQSSGFWQIVNDINDPRGRHENGYVEANGKFYLIGGRNDRPMQIYDPVDNTWTNGTNPPNNIELHHFQAATIGDKIYVVGAYTGPFPDEDLVSNIYIYDVVTDSWDIGPEIPADRRRAAAGVVVYNGQIAIVCGSTGGHGSFSVRKAQFDLYNPATNQWTTMPDAPHVRDHVHAAIIENKLYVAGGRDGGLNDNVPEVDVFDFGSNQWSTLPSETGDIPTPRAGAASIAVDHFLIVIGGESAAQVVAHNEAEVLNTRTGTWFTIDRLEVGRHGTQAIFYDDKLYIASGSGQQGGSPELTNQEVFDVTQETTLPVELAPEFLALIDQDNVVLQWQTLSEVNNAGFEVQQMQDGAFVTIGFAEGYGTSVVPRRYTYTVQNLPPGRHVFRLKQIDFDGSFAYSEPVSAYLELEESYVLGPIYPNPLNPQARFTLSLIREQHVEIDVFDLMGRRIERLHEGPLLPHTPYTFELDASGWAGGKYVLHVKGAYLRTSRFFTILK